MKQSAAGTPPVANTCMGDRPFFASWSSWLGLGLGLGLGLPRAAPAVSPALARPRLILALTLVATEPLTKNARSIPVYV